MNPLSAVLVATVLGVASATLEPDEAVCWSCFWRDQPEGFRGELIGVYDERRFADPFLDVQRRLLVARVRRHVGALCGARAELLPLEGTRALRDASRALLAAEILAFTAAECGAEPEAAFHHAAEVARGAGQGWKRAVYESVAAGTFSPIAGDAAVAKRAPLRSDAEAFVLGASRIEVRTGTPIGAQVERVARDWLSYQLGWNERDRPIKKGALIGWHEGARLRELLEATRARVIPLTGTLAARFGDRWLAPDPDGTFRFEVGEDKIEYPTTLAYRRLALLIDTHGISALVEPALRERASLVVGCGDTEDKMKAAFALATRGVNVWFPCDRFAGDVVGYDAPGVLVGSAPVRREGRRAIIGDTPVTIRLRETIVVQDFAGRGDDRYYDAPARYFRALAAYLPGLKTDFVVVDGAGRSGRIVDRARELAAPVIAVRVASDADAAPVRAWLAASRGHRAVLFHSTAYPAGNALFVEFPGQTTFGDARPKSASP